MIKKLFTPKFSGFFWSNLAGFTIIGITRFFMTSYGNGALIFSEFVIIPILVGAIAGWFWKGIPAPTRKMVLLSIVNSFLSILLSAVFLKEGVICLLIVSPLIFCFMLIGVTIGSRLNTMKNNRLNTSFVLLLAAVFIGDVFSNHDYENQVSDTVTIKAPPAVVWQNVVAFKRIKAAPKFWLFNLGLPNPVESTVTGYYKGAGRKCIFSNNYVFDEVISTYDQGKNLTFDIKNQPRDPEIMNHIAIERGQFVLKDNGDGTTTLVGNSWYRLYVFPVWYYDMWAKSITRNVHLRVMQHIKELSEQ